MIIWRVNRELRAYNVLRFKCYSIKNYCLAKVSFLQDKNKNTQSRYNIRVKNQLCYKRQNNKKKKHIQKNKQTTKQKQKKTLKQQYRQANINRLTWTPESKPCTRKEKKHVLSLHREFDKCQYFVRKIINTRLLCERKGNTLVNLNITYPCQALHELDIHNRSIKQYQLSKTFMVSITKEIKLK